MKWFNIGVVAMALGAFVPTLGACSSGDQSEQNTLGTVRLNLTGTGNGGTLYRLRNANFVVTGPVQLTLSSETDVNALSIKQELPAGNYVINLNANWSLEKLVNGTFVPVKAVLASANPLAFQITDQGVTGVAFQFNAGDDVVALGDGTLDLTIDVNDGAGGSGQGGSGQGGSGQGGSGGLGQDGTACIPSSQCLSGLCHKGLCTPVNPGTCVTFCSTNCSATVMSSCSFNHVPVASCQPDAKSMCSASGASCTCALN